MEHSGWTSRGYITHCDGADLVQHIVFATAGQGDEIQKHFGAHVLKGDAASAVEAALLHFDGVRYRLLAWCVMANHVHVALQQMSGWPLARIVHSWKSYTANAINELHAKSGAVWQRDYFDRYMRDDDHLAATIRYVEANPVKAGLVERPEDWPWSSARRRKT